MDAAIHEQTRVIVNEKKYLQGQIKEIRPNKNTSGRLNQCNVVELSCWVGT